MLGAQEEIRFASSKKYRTHRVGTQIGISIVFVEHHPEREHPTPLPRNEIFPANFISTQIFPNTETNVPLQTTNQRSYLSRATTMRDHPRPHLHPHPPLPAPPPPPPPPHLLFTPLSVHTQTPPHTHLHTKNNTKNNKNKSLGKRRILLPRSTTSHHNDPVRRLHYTRPQGRHLIV